MPVGGSLWIGLMEEFIEREPVLDVACYRTLAQVITRVLRLLHGPVSKSSPASSWLGLMRHGVIFEGTTPGLRVTQQTDRDLSKYTSWVGFNYKHTPDISE